MSRSALASACAEAASVPECSVRESDRATHVRLVISPREGLVVVVPRGYPAHEVPGLVAEKRAWIQRSLRRLDGRPELFAAGPEALLPDNVELVASGEPPLPVTYRHTEAVSVRAYRHDEELVVSGAVTDAGACLSALRRWADREARRLLSGLVEAYSARMDVGVREVRVGFRQTRWGSCSTRGVVSLNRNLVFLPARLAHAVIMHELTHMVRRDHSSAFWDQLETVDPRAREHRRELRHAQLLIPPWADG